MTDPDPTSPLWDAIKDRAAELGIPVEALAASNTRTKLKRGTQCAPYVYENIDKRLGWVRGDAARCFRDGTPPRPVEGETGRVELMRTAGDIVIAAAGADFPALQAAKGAADEALRALRPDD